MYGIVLLLHILAATIWTGGHLVLALAVFPRVLRHKAPEELLQFESAYERLGIPALFVLIATGLWLAYRLIPDVSQWFHFDNPIARLISLKLLLLVLTAALAIDARLRLIPKLSERNLWSMALHAYLVTVLSVLFVVVGVSFRTGWFY